MLLLALPTSFDLVATVLMNVGLLYVTASVYQMMRGAEMLFAATFAILFLGRRLNFYHLMGIICCVVSSSSPVLQYRSALLVQGGAVSWRPGGRPGGRGPAAWPRPPPSAPWCSQHAQLRKPLHGSNQQPHTMPRRAHAWSARACSMRRA